VSDMEIKTTDYDSKKHPYHSMIETNHMLTEQILQLNKMSKKDKKHIASLLAKDTKAMQAKISNATVKSTYGPVVPDPMSVEQHAAIRPGFAGIVDPGLTVWGDLDPEVKRLVAYLPPTLLRRDLLETIGVREIISDQEQLNIRTDFNKMVLRELARRDITYKHVEDCDKGSLSGTTIKEVKGIITEQIIQDVDSLVMSSYTFCYLIAKLVKDMCDQICEGIGPDDTALIVQDPHVVVTNQFFLVKFNACAVVIGDSDA
jgi:hypothetical protein